MEPKRTIGIAVAAAGLCGIAGVGCASTLPNWYRAEVADVIVIGKLQVAPNTPEVAKTSSEPFALTVEVTKVLKGKVGGSSVLLHLPVVTDDAKLAEAKFQEYAGKQVIAFAYSSPSGYFINQYDVPSQIVLNSNEVEVGVRKDLADNASSASKAAAFVGDKTTDKKVADSISDLASDQRATREQGINQLVELGCAGVPYIIENMHSDKSLNSDFLFNAKSADARAALINEHPKTVYDAASYLLSYITGLSFLRTAELRTQEQRDVDYHGWLTYLSRNLAGQSEGSKCK